jgi:hypothetical protein
MNIELNDIFNEEGKRTASYDNNNEVSKKQLKKKFEDNIYEHDLIETIANSSPIVPLQTHEWVEQYVIPPTQTWFTIRNNANQPCIVFMKNPIAFKDMFVVVGSFPKRHAIIIDPKKPLVESNVIIFKCDRCQEPEHIRAQCGTTEWSLQAFPMYGIVFNGQPQRVCVKCLHAYNAKGFWSYDHENNFYNALYKEENATVRIVNPYDKNATFAELEFIPNRINFSYSSRGETCH